MITVYAARLWAWVLYIWRNDVMAREQARVTRKVLRAAERALVALKTQKVEDGVLYPVESLCVPIGRTLMSDVELIFLLRSFRQECQPEAGWAVADVARGVVTLRLTADPWGDAYIAL